MIQPKITKSGRLSTAVSVGLLLAAAANFSSAAVRTWDGGGDPDINWSTAANWVDDIAPVQGDDLVFAGTVGLTNNNDLAVNTWFNSITFVSGAGAFYLDGNQMRIGANNGNKGVTNSSPNIQVINIETKNDRQVNYDTTGASIIFSKLMWDQRYSKSGPNDLILLQSLNTTLNGQITSLTGGRVIMNGQLGGSAGQGVQINTGGTALCAGPANQIGDTDTRADVTMAGGVLQVQNTNALGAATFEQIPMLRSSDATSVVENGSALGPVQLRVGGGTGARVGAFDGALRDGTGGGALSLVLNNSSGAVYWRLGGNSSYSGDTIVTNGFISGFTRLLVNGQSSGGGNYFIEGSTASSRSVLGGAGLITAGTVNVNANGAIAPGGVLAGTALYTRQGGGGSGSAGVNTGTFAESTATLTITNNVSLTDVSSALDIHLGGTNIGSYDQLVVAGSGVFSNNSANLQLTIDLGFVPAGGDKFTIVDVAGTSAANNIGVFGSLNGVATDLSQGATITLGGVGFKISYRAEGNTFDAGAGNGNNIMLEALPDTSAKLTWRGDVDGDWDIVGKLNWRDTNNVAVTFTNFDKVTFNDAGVTTNINLTTDLNPASILVDSTKNYLFAGVGKLTGAMVITKTNTGTLTLTTANDNVGAAVIEQGTLQIGAGGTDGALTCAVTVNSNGVFAINRSDDLVLSSTSGKGVVLHNGSGKVTVVADLSGFTGTVSNNVGTFQLGDGTTGGNSAKIGGPVAVAAGATLSHNYNGAADVTVANSMRGNGSATFEFSVGSARTVAFGPTVTNTGFTGTTTVKAFTRLNVAAAAAAPAGPIIVESAGSPAFGSYYSHPGATVTNFNSITLAGEGPASPVDSPRGKGALRLGNVWAGPVVLSANATIGGDGTGTIIGNISDGGNNYTLEYLGGTIQVGPAAGAHTYGQTHINEDYNGSFTSPTLTTVRALNANAFGPGPISMKGRARLELNGNNVAIANLNDVTITTLNGTSFAPVVANGSGTTAATLTLGSDNITGPVFIGTFINGSTQPLGLTKVGSGTFTVSGDSTTTGTIAVNAGTLALAAATGVYPDSTAVTGSGSFSNATLLTVAAGATLDVLGRGDQTLTLNNGQTLGGSGTVNGAVVTTSGGNIAPGSSVGTLTVAGNITLGGNLTIELNRALSPNSDRLVTSGGSITGGGTLTLTNIGAVLQPGDTFQVFAAGVSGITVPAQTVDYVNAVTYTWQNNIAASGTVTLLSVTPITAPTLNVGQSGNQLTFSWTGPFKLQSQTNSLNVGISSNWGNYPGGSTSPVNVTINPANPTVFFRLSLQ